MKNYIKISIGIFLSMLFISTLLLHSQDTTLVNNLNILTVNLQSLTHLLKPSRPSTFRSRSIIPLPPVTLRIGQDDRELAFKIVFDDQNPSIANLLNTTNQLIIQNVKAVGEPLPTDFQASLREPNEVNNFFFSILTHQYKLGQQVASFYQVRNDQKISVIESIIFQIDRGQQLSDKIDTIMEELGKLYERRPESIFRPLYKKARLIAHSEQIFLKLYFMGIVSRIPTVTLAEFKAILEKSTILTDLENITVIYGSTKERFSPQEYTQLQTMLNGVVQHYVISKFPKTEEWQKYGPKLQQQLSEALDKSVLPN